MLVHALTNAIQVLDDAWLGALASLLGINGRYAQPDWARPCAWLLALCVPIYALAFGPCAPGRAAAGGLFALAGAAILVQGLLLWQGLWLPLAFPLAMLVLCTLGPWAVPRPPPAQTKASDSRAEYEKQRMLGLVLQGQGELEKAFGLFRSLPTSPALLDNLSNLALDFERKRALAKARKVFKHILQRDGAHGPAREGYRRVREIQDALANIRTRPHATPPSPPDAPAPPLPRLGRYQAEKLLGRGAMGAVYLARDLAIGRALAVKTLALGEEFDGLALDEARRRFFREAEAAGRLQHPHIVTIHDTGESGGVAYIAMELLAGHDLSHAAAPGQLLPVEQVLSIAARVADALDYAHSRHVIHRDIKPGNIMFDAATDAVKVMDFGIARITDAHKTRTGVVLGTPSFMPPEQLAGKGVDGRSDLYALGVTLFQLLTGMLPLRADSMAELMRRIACTPAPDVRSARPDLPQSVAQVVARLLSKTREDRYQTGAQLARALRQCLQSMTASIGQGAGESVVYDAGPYAEHGASGGNMVDFQQTVMETPASPDVPARSGPLGVL